jgi:hypothetical protein
LAPVKSDGLLGRLRSAHDTPDRKLMISFRNIMSQTLKELV